MQRITTDRYYVWPLTTDRKDPFYGGLQVQLEMAIQDIANLFNMDPADIAYDVYMNINYKDGEKL